MTAVFDYSAYRLRIRCDIPLPELVSAEFDGPEITIARGRVDGPDAPYGEWEVAHAGDDIHLSLGGFARFVIRGRARIEYEPLPGVDTVLLNFAILGPLMALLLHERGLFVLHGSAISIGGQAAMFVGDKGAGKSTTLGAILSAGYPMLTDDVLAIVPGGRPPVVIPGYPQIKLDPAAADRFTLPAHHVIPTPAASFDKRRIRFDGSFADEPATARAVYVLTRGDVAEARRLDPAEALGALMRFSYTVRFGEAVLGGARGPAYFARTAAIANAVPVYALHVPGEVARIHEVLPLIERHAAAA